MIARLSGRCVHIDDESIILDVGGVGYLVRATAEVLRRAATHADEVVVHVHTNVRDDAIQLFGFASAQEQLVFERLIGLQGVGPKVAIAIVSSYAPGDIRRAAENEDVALFQSISGVGPKVARRIVTELRDKLGDVAAVTTLSAHVDDGGFYDARDALVELGLSVPVAEAALRETDEQDPVDERIRRALQVARA